MMGMRIAKAGKVKSSNEVDRSIDFAYENKTRNSVHVNNVSEGRPNIFVGQLVIHATCRDS
jgi:hypothetical protein